MYAELPKKGKTCEKTGEVQEISFEKEMSKEIIFFRRKVAKD